MEPALLSRRANRPEALIDKNEQILRSMLTIIRKSSLRESERREIISKVTLPRVLLRQGHLGAIVKAGPVAGTRALRRLSKLLADPLVADLDPAGPHLESPAAPHLQSLAARWVTRARRFVDAASRPKQGRVASELALLRRSVEDMRKEQRRLEANLQAEFQLRDMLSASESSKPKAAITPLNPGWQLSSQAMQEVVRHVLLEEPKVVVECGSGGSTMWIGRALRRVGEGRLISLENSADWVVIVTGLLQHEGLRDVDVRHAPLEPIQVASHEQLWYSASALADVEGIDLLLVDGPPGRTNKLARYPAVPALRDKLRPGATVMLDDCHRRDEKETLRRWLAEVPGLSLVRHVDHLAVMKIS
jgi:Methyltransferase domain